MPKKNKRNKSKQKKKLPPKRTHKEAFGETVNNKSIIKKNFIVNSKENAILNIKLNIEEIYNLINIINNIITINKNIINPNVFDKNFRF